MIRILNSPEKLFYVGREHSDGSIEIYAANYRDDITLLSSTPVASFLYGDAERIAKTLNEKDEYKSFLKPWEIYTAKLEKVKINHLKKGIRREDAILGA